jgi:hypothetical protein
MRTVIVSEFLSLDGHASPGKPGASAKSIAPSDIAPLRSHCFGDW